MAIRRVFRFIVIIITLFLVVFYIQAYSLYKRSRNAQDWVTHTNIVINRLENIYADIWEVQGARRTELDAAAKLRFETNIRKNIDSLDNLILNNQIQKQRLSSLDKLITKKFELLNETDVLAGGKNILKLDDQIKKEIGVMISAENDLLRERTENYENYSKHRFLFSIVSFSLLGLFLYISLYQIFNNLVKRNRAERMANEHEEKYRRLIESSQFTSTIVGRDNIIKFVTANVLQLVGKPKEELIGTIVNLDMPNPEDFENNPDNVFKVVEVKFPHRTEGYRWIAYRIFPLFDADHKVEDWQIVAWDIDAEKRMQEQVSALNFQKDQQQKLLQDIIDNIPSAVYIKDREGKYVIVNKKFCEIWHRNPDEILGRKDIEVFADQNRRDSYQVADKQVLEHKSMVTLEDTMVREGKVDHYWIIKFPLLDDNGEVVNICGLATNITERKENEFKLLKANRAAESARIAQEAFLANMSHEIRTPMNGIMGMSNLLLSTTQTGEQEEYAESILESARHLLAIINDILDFSKIKAGKFLLEYIPFKPRHVIKKVIYPLQFKADEKMVRLSLNLDENVPEVLNGDPLRLQQILINLVGNALKFTEQGRVDISVRCRNADPGYCVLEVLVKDTGIGIPREKLQMIFESFTQNNVNTSRKYGGTGLGLAIVKQLVELQKGRVWVDSEPGEGSTFGFTIPYTIGQMPASAAITPSSAAGGSARLMSDLKILVAEDNLINQKVVNITLSKQGAEVFIAANGRLAIEALQREHFDVILMDLQMPEIDGYHATRIIRKEIDDTIPIIAMTADALKGEAEKCYDAGMNGYISKPFEPKELYEEILRLTKKRDNMQNNSSAGAPVDLTYLFELSGNDSGYINEVLDLFLGTMEDGLKQLEHLIMETEEWDDIHRQAHFLKSSVSVVQVKDMFDNLARIEALAQSTHNKLEMKKVLSDILTMYKTAEPILLAEKAKHQKGKI